MKLTVLTVDTHRPVHLSVLGLELELDSLPFGQELTISGDVGGLAVTLIDPDDLGIKEEDTPEEVLAIAPTASVALQEAAFFPSVVVQPEQTLYQRLVKLRREVADDEGVSPYLVFHDRSLREMEQRMPSDMEAFGRISGVGQVKLERYGETFLAAISKYRQEVA